MRWWTLALILLAVSSCTTEPQPSQVTTTTEGLATTTTQPTDEICKIGDLKFGDDGLVAALGEDVGDAATLSHIRWEEAASCERITVAFASRSGAPARTLGPTGVSVLSYASVVRVALPPELSSTAVADMLADGDLIERAFVIRTDEGSMFVDIHAPHGVAISARAFTTGSPATLVIDVIAAADGSHRIGTVESPTAIVMTPPPGPTIYPFAVEGYAAPGETATRIQLSSNGDEVADRSLSLPGWTDTWQTFSTTIPDGPSGTVEIVVSTGDPDAGAIVVVDVP